MSLGPEDQVCSPQRPKRTSLLRGRLSWLFSRSEVSLKELQRQAEEEEEEEEDAVGTKDPQLERGKRRKRPKEPRALRRTREEEEDKTNSACAKPAKQPPKPPHCGDTAGSTHEAEGRASQPAATGSSLANATATASALSYSEPDLWRNGILRTFGRFAWRKRRGSHREPSEHCGNAVSDSWPLGRLQRPAVGSTLDMRSWSDSCHVERQSEKQGGPVLLRHPSETYSLGPSLVPSTSFDSLLCWGEGGSWDGSSSVSSSSLCCTTSPEIVEGTTQVPSVQEETDKVPGPRSERAGRALGGGCLTSGTSWPTLAGEVEDLSSSHGLEGSISEQLSREEGPQASSPGVKRAPEVANAVWAAQSSSTKAATKIHYAITITLTKRESEDESAKVEPAAGCGERGLPCRSSGQGALSPGVAELQKTEEQHHPRKPARPAPQLSAHKEFQNCTGLCRVGTSEVCRLILPPTAGSLATGRWEPKPSPRPREGRSEADRLHSRDGLLAEGTAVVGPGPLVISLSKPRGIAPAANGKDAQPRSQCDVGRSLFLAHLSMEEVTGGSRSSQSRLGGPRASASFHWKTRIPGSAKEDSKPPLGKVPARGDGGRARGRPESPSRVSVLLEAWEKGLVGMESGGPSSSTGPRRSRSPAPARRLLSSKDAAGPLSSANTRSSLSTAGPRRSLSPADTRWSHSAVDARSPSPADPRRSFSSAGARRSRSPADRRRSPSPADTRRVFPLADTQQPCSPGENRRSSFLADNRCPSPLGGAHRSSSPGQSRYLSAAAENHGSSSPSEMQHRSSSLADGRRSSSVADMRRFYSPAEARRSSSPADTRQSPSPEDARSPFLVAEARWPSYPANARSPFSGAEARPSSSRSSSPADTRCFSSPEDIKTFISAADTRRSSSPADSRHSSFPMDAGLLSSLADPRGPFSMADSRHSSSRSSSRSSSPAGTRRSSSPEDAGSLFSVADARHPFPPADTKRASSPPEAKRTSSPASSRSFSPATGGKRSRSLSPRRDFTAHGPVFSQVYSPVSKPKSQVGAEMEDAASTVAAGSQGERPLLGATSPTLATGFQEESHTLSTDGSQEKSLLSASVSARAMESQRGSHEMSGGSSSTSSESWQESHLPSGTGFTPQIEGYLSRANATSFSRSLRAGQLSSAVSTKPPGGSPVLKPRMVRSSTVAESQTQWYGSTGGSSSSSTVVFRSEEQVVLPHAGKATVYRAGREIIVSSSGVGSKHQQQEEARFPSPTASNPSPKEDHQQQPRPPEHALADATSPSESLASIPDACKSPVAGPRPEKSCVTHPRSAGVCDTQRERRIPGPSPACTSKRDAATRGEGGASLGTAQQGCSTHSSPALQKGSDTVSASRPASAANMPVPGGLGASCSEQGSRLSRAEKVPTSGSPSSWCVADAGGTAGRIRRVRASAGPQETAPGGQRPTTQPEQRAAQSQRAKGAQALAQEPTNPLAEVDSSHEPTRHQQRQRGSSGSSETAEEEPEEGIDMELFVDTLRNMEPPELRKPLRLPPRLPRPSTLAKHAPLPPIHEHHVTPKSKVHLPVALGELFALAEERSSAEGPGAQEEEEGVGPAEEDEEIENPYLSPADRPQEDSSQPRMPYPWENKPYKTEEEIGSFLGKLQERTPQPKAKPKAVVPKEVAQQSHFTRANILKGASLLAGFVEKKAVEDKPYSRLDNSLLYSKFISQQKPPIRSLQKGKEVKGSPPLLTPAVLKVSRECQTSPNGPQAETCQQLSSKVSPPGLRTETLSRVPPAVNSHSSQICLPVGGPESLPHSLARPEDLNEEKNLPKINVRPGKIILYSEAGFAGPKREIWGEITDATSWELSHTISIRVVRGGWVMYEKPRFHGRKCVLAEGDVEITNPWKMYHKEGAAEENSPFQIGSLKRVVRDYRIPEIALFTEENGEGTKQRFTDSSEDTRTHNQPLMAASIIVHSGLWLVYSKPFFDDDPYVLEPGGYPSLQAWGAKDPSICSMHPIKLGCPVVEKPGEPKALIYEQPHFQGHSWEVSRDIYDVKKPENNQDSKMATVGSLRILGGCWVAYEKEGFRGHQYLLEEGEYFDWSQWGGYSEQLVSLRLIRTGFLDPALVLFEAMDFEDGPSVEFSEALPDVELANYGTTTQSIHVLSGVWVAYEGKNFTGEQYILEKGVYRNCEDWGASSCQISSVQPILQVGEHSLHFLSKIQLFSDPDFLGTHVSFTEDQTSLPENFIPRSCRVHGGSWILYDDHQYTKDQHILSEGEYPTLTSMGCLGTTAIRSLKKVPIFFSEPSIFLHGLECFEGKEIELNSEVRSLQAEGFNNHVLSVRVKGGIWVLCEHSDFRGHQWLLDCVEITNWLTYSGLQHIGSLYPIRQRRIYFQIKNKELTSFLSVPDDVEDMKAGRVLVSELNDKVSSIWYYEEGLMKNQVAPNMSLQVIGSAGKGAKVVLWSESRVPRQTWRVDSDGRICSQMFEDKVLDVKGGRTYDRDHAILWDSSEERPTQIWAVQVL